MADLPSQFKDLCKTTITAVNTLFLLIFRGIAKVINQCLSDENNCFSIIALTIQ